MFVPTLVEGSVTGETARMRVALRGCVQGVGFRPFVYRLARSMGLNGWIKNGPAGVTIEVEGGARVLESFLGRLMREKPALSSIQGTETSYLDPAGYDAFEIKPSEAAGQKTALMLPDIAACDECVSEIFTRSDRRYRYPFTNCTRCGPRYTIIDALPYDRSNTTMKTFTMCGKCMAEFNDPKDRRFHAQPNACAECGPRLEFWDAGGRSVAKGGAALHYAEEAISGGRIVALKGLGGFMLLADASNAAAVHRLRNLKNRAEKPFALMYPSLSAVRAACETSRTEERLLGSPQSPIVLLKRRNRASVVARNAAGANPYLGVMLPYTPLHHLLMSDLNFPIIATSGNLKDEPICTDERDALARLSAIADCFLVHNRPIARHVDDSVVRMMSGRPMVLRRSRGYAPLPVTLPRGVPSLLAVGAHLKNTLSFSSGRDVFISQHIGDLETAQSLTAFDKAAADLKSLYGDGIEGVARDAHPDYLSTRRALEMNHPRTVTVQHHYAHVLSCMADNDLDEGVLGVAWDGTGYGTDGTIWGGEFLRVGKISYERAAHFRTFALPGGERSVREPRRTALGLLYELFGEAVFNMKDLIPVSAFSPRELGALQGMLRAGFQCPVTSSAGRLFDAVASILGIQQRSSFEGQAAMELEHLQDGFDSDKSYPIRIEASMEAHDHPSMVVDWEPLVTEILRDAARGTPGPIIAAAFHNAMAEAVVRVAERVGEKKVALTGGCFQNKTLSERAVRRLREEGFQPYWHQRIPPNDGGISVGQILAAARALEA